MNKAAIFHRVDCEYCYLLDEKTCVLRIRSAKDDLKSVSVFYGNRCHQEQKVPVKEVPMTKVATGALHDYYEVQLQPGFRRMFYYFLLDDGNEKLYYYEDEFHKVPAEDRTYFYQLPYFRREECYRTPEWASKAVIYQIFPDSFATGHKVHENKPRVIDFNGIKCSSKVGGTLKGVTENIDYLKDLGITCIYFNPIFVANSYHKYDIADYKTIDPSFGTNEEFKEMVSVLHENGIKIVLDGVFNHSGPGFFAYQDILKNQEKSKYKNWYYDMPLPLEKGFKSDYACFAYVKSMPKLNTGNPEVAEYFAEVGKFWIQEYDVDGWRLDVANEIDKEFWRTFHKAIKSVKKDAIMIAEVWEDAQNWQNYDEFDSAMNYRFTNLCKSFFAKKEISSAEFGQRFYESLMRYPSPVSYAQMNLLDSHDVPRFLSVCGNDLNRFKLAVTCQFTLPGMPSVYAGDERAMFGVKESEYRAPFAWTDEGYSYVEGKPSEMTKWYKDLISLRKSHEALTAGRIRFIDSKNDEVLAFERFTEKEKMTVYINNSEKSYIIPEKNVEIKPYGMLIY